MCSRGVRLLGVMLFVVSCNIAPEQKKIRYFDVQDLLAREAKRLAHTGSTCEKYMQLGDSKQSLQLRQDSSQWMRSWRHLLSIDLNEATKLSPYDSSKQQIGPLHLTTYEATSPSSSRLQSLTLLKNSHGRLQELRAYFKEKSLLYSRDALLSLRLSVDEPSRLLHYALEGYQKIRTQDTLHYKIRWSCP